MKKNIIKTLSAAAGILLLAACTNENGIGTDVDAGSITIQATIGQMTKVENKGNATNFINGDKILLYGWTGSDKEIPATRVVDSVVNSFDGTVWTPAKQMNWKNATDAHYFLGIYPVPDSVTSFTAAAYKLNPAEYESSDLLIAANLDGVTVADGPVNLTFEHTMAKLNVNLKFRNEFGGTPNVKSVTATALDSATVNYLTKEVTAAGTSAPVVIPAASAAAGYDLSYSGLMVPQDGVHKVTVTIGNRKYVYESKNAIPLHSGKYTTLGLNVGRDTIELSTISIADWKADDTSLADAEAVLYDPYNGHEYVDMGLSVKWATCNVGASAKDEYGDYFAWGDPAPKNVFGWSQYKWCNGSETSLTKYNYNSDIGIVDNKSMLDLEDDAAHAKWGGSWRIPTPAECAELLNDDKCTWDWKTTDDGYTNPGYLVTSKINGNSIFLPAAGHYYFNSVTEYVGSHGYYWSSLLHTDGSVKAYYFRFNSTLAYTHVISRVFGLSVRPVCP